ncbi:SMP-30/gluconolactonase/LRE family protein [Chitinophaga defluvii]|uniref:SMP-30/gluconolactonase/LRE family protein n=1 Tax=Chitinophaga defluvii TaxID=3163343 RepID=A0ABV2T5I5_9BACT
MKATLLHPSVCGLGEGPLWHKQRNSLFWVDILAGRLFEYNWTTAQVQQWEVGHMISLVVPGKNKEEVILCMQGGVGRFNLLSGQLSPVTDLGLDWTTLRCNDGICDNQGRLWIGTTEIDHAPAGGILYCIDAAHQAHERIPDVTISNGMAWSLDNKRLYHTDSVTHEIRSYIYKEETGEIIFEKVAVKVPEEKGTPDGFTIDKEGMLWVALWGGFGVGRWNPDTGEMIGFVEVPVPNVSCCVFAGEQLDHLVITTARKELSEQQLREYPDSGNVYMIKPGTNGVEAFDCVL